MPPMRNRATRVVRRAVRAGIWMVAAALAALGVLTAQIAVVMLAVFAALAGGLAGYVAVRGLDDLGAQRSPVSVPIMVGAVAGPCAVLVVAGLTVCVGATAVPIVVMVLALALWRRHRLFGPAGTPTAGVGPSLVDLRETLAALSDDELARSWQRSHTRLTQAVDGAELGRVGAMRRWQLDEMERRDPAGFRRWVDSGTWVTGDSVPFLRR